MATKPPQRPDSNIQAPGGQIQPPWNIYFTAMERSIRSLEALPVYANDAAAAAGGLPLYGFYTTAGVVHQRVV